MARTDGKRLVLVAEDESELREMIGEFLVEAGFEVIMAENGEEALLKVKENSQLDAILSDISMPKMNGIDLIRNIRQLGNDIPICILSAYGDKETVLEALRLGATDYLEKPFKETELVEVVSRSAEIGFRRKRLENALIGQSSEMKANLEKEKKLIHMVQVYNSVKRKAS